MGWRRRLLLVPAMLALAAATMGQESCEDLAKEGGGTGGSGAGGEGGGAPKVKKAKVGDRLTLKGTTYRVTDVRTDSRVGGQFTRSKASGRFVIVDLSLTNRKDEPATLFQDNIRLIGGNGKKYSVSDDALLVLDDQLTLLDEIQPDVTEKGSLIYDVPKSAVSGSKLQVEDLSSEAKGQINLGL